MLSKLRLGRVMPELGVSVFQSSFAAPAPVARFSSSSPFVTRHAERVEGEREADPGSVDAEPALGALGQVETSFRLAPAAPTPPALTVVSSVKASAWALVSVWPVVESLPVHWPSSRLPVPVAVKTPARATVAVPEMCRSRSLSKSRVGRVIPEAVGGEGLPVELRRAGAAGPVQLQLAVREAER